MRSMRQARGRAMPRMSVRHIGGAASPVVFLADHGVSASVWRDVAVRMTPPCAWVEADLVGSGQSPAVTHARPESPDPEPYELAEQVDALFDAVERLDLEPFTLVGHGFGALVADRFALHYQDLLRGLVLVNPLTDRVDAWRAAMRAADPGTLATRALSSEAARILAAAHRAAPESWDAVAHHARSVALRAELWPLELPVLLICGDHAPFTDLGAMARLAGTLRRASLCVINDVGHLPMLEAPEQTAAALTRFLASARGPRAHLAPGAWGERIACVWPDETELADRAPDPAPRSAVEIAEAYVRGQE